MKTNVLLFSLISSIAIGAFAQTSGGGSSSGSAGAGQPARTSNPNQAMPGAQNRQLQPGLQNRNQLTPGVESTTTTNSFVSTNQVGMNTNQFQGTNNLTPTGNTSGTNQPNNNITSRDQAFTASDTTVLNTIRQNLQTQFGITFASSPVRFIINQGAVTIVGSVPTADENQRILLLVQQTPGVVRVDNRVAVAGTPTQRSPFSPVPNTNARDVAFTAQDQQLLSAVRSTAGTQLGINSAPSTELPVHFNIDHGVVGVTGSVASMQAKQALVRAIQAMPGVTRVVDNLQVSPTSGTVPTSTLVPTNTGGNNLPPSFHP